MKTPHLRSANDSEEPLGGDAPARMPGPSGGDRDAEIIRERFDAPPEPHDIAESVHDATLGATPNEGQGLTPNDLVQTPVMRENVAKRLREARERAGYATASDAARAFGWNLPSYLGHEGGKRGLRPTVAAQYARAFRVKSSWLLYGEAESHSVQVRTLDRSVPVIGEVRAGAWTEVAYCVDYTETITVSLPEYDRAALFGLVVCGRSMDKLYSEGTVVIVCPAHEAGLRNEDHVVVRRHRNGLVETTLKQLVVSRTGAVELWPRSTDPVHQLPLKYERNEHADDGIEIIGVVVASYLPKRAGRGPTLDL